MEKQLLLILQCCNTLHTTKEELNTPFSFLKFKQKKEYKDLKSQIIESIKNLKSIKWNVDYLYKVERALVFYHSYLEDYFTDFYIDEDAFKSYESSRFYTMYFQDKENYRIITLDIISDNINFTIMDTRLGNSFTVSSSGEISESQHKIEEFCKKIFIDFLMDFLKEKKYNPVNEFGDDKDD